MKDADKECLVSSQSLIFLSQTHQTDGSIMIMYNCRLCELRGETVDISLATYHMTLSWDYFRNGYEWHEQKMCWKIFTERKKSRKRCVVMETNVEIYDIYSWILGIIADMETRDLVEGKQSFLYDWITCLDINLKIWSQWNFKIISYLTTNCTYNLADFEEVTSHELNVFYCLLFPSSGSSFSVNSLPLPIA